MIKKSTTPTKAPAAKTSTRTRKSDVSTTPDIKNNADLLSQIKIDLKHKNEVQKKLTLAIKNGDVTICTGPAGTGKTFLSVAEALLLLKNHPDKYHEIKLVKSIIQLKGEDLGTLPGDEKDKLKFVMLSFLDAFNDTIGSELTEKLIEAGYIKMEVFGSMRGRSIKNCIILFDEFQNVSDKNGKTFLTRFSDNTKVVILGDSNQVDLDKPETSCLSELINMTKLYPEEGVNVVEFSGDEIVRHRLTKYFIKIFEHKDYKKKEGKVIPAKPKSQIIKEKGFFENILSLFR